MNKKKYFSLFVFITFFSLYCFPQINNNIVLDKEAELWADSVLNSLTLKEKIGQMIIVRGSSNGDVAEEAIIEKYIKEYNIGGICFFKGDPTIQAKLTNKWQKLSKIPMFISMDAEWGLEMRLKDKAMAFPKQMTLGAIRNDMYIKKMGEAIANQLKRLGVNMSFAPCVDINNNPNNPVINYRSFGEDPENVALKGVIYMKALQENGIIAVAKHFPGHGDTNVDSHYSLPVIKHDLDRLNKIELYPFTKMIEYDVAGIMNAHLYIPSLDKIKRPASLSLTIVNKLLKENLKYNGLIMTDGLEMGAITSYKPAGEVEVAAVLAGNDILLLPLDVKKAVDSVYNAVNNGTISKVTIDNSCKKILKYKYKYGINNYNEVSLENIEKDINLEKDKALLRELYTNATTVIKNKNDILPLSLETNIKTACLVISNDNCIAFTEMVKNYCKADYFNLKLNSTEESCNKIFNKLKKYDRTIVLVASSTNSPKSNFGVSTSVISGLENFSKLNNAILCLAINPYFASKIVSLNNYSAIVLGYENVIDVLEILPQQLFGAYEIDGQLPVSIANKYPVLFGEKIEKTNVLQYLSEDEIVNLFGDLSYIDSIAIDGIDIKAYPGCQIFAAYDGKVIYNKSFGKQTYSKTSLNINNYTLFDMASVTKVAATNISVMYLYDNALIDIDKPISDYLTFLKESNKKNIDFRNTMAHQARFVSYIPFKKDFINDESFRKKWSSNTKSNIYNVKVADNFYVKKEYKKFLLDSIANSKMQPRKRMVYSDLGYILISEVINKITGKTLDVFADSIFYSKMGLYNTTFNPLNKFDKNRIAPTENDNLFRHQLVQGYVHDENAGLLGGVSGHAGLFSTAKEVGTIMQMLLNGGNYGNKQYISQGVVNQFTSVQYREDDNRKGCGFDKPGLKENNPVCEGASKSSFGHTGFTGIYAWADPDKKLVYVFVSNRVYPDASNRKISRYDIRTRIHQCFYNILEDSL